MHEISFCKSILNIVLTHAKKSHVHKIKKIHLEVGELVRLDHSAMQFGFNAVAENTLAEGAKLEFTVISPKIFCEECCQYSSITQYGDVCVYCGSTKMNIVKGEEFQVKAMEVE